MNRTTEAVDPLRLCAYCDRAAGVEDDHVVARQFFPPTEDYRGGLPKVPSCGDCNRAKQKVEDGPAVFMQIGHESPASWEVLTKRVPRTLAKNKRIRDSLASGLTKAWLKNPSGLITEQHMLRLSPRDVRDLNLWFRYVVRGLFRYELGRPLPSDYILSLAHPQKPEQRDVLLRIIHKDRNYKYRSFAQGEFQYIVARNEEQQISAWLIYVKSFEMGAATAGPDVLDTLKSVLHTADWRHGLDPRA